MSTNSSLLSLVNFKVDTAGAPRILGFQLLIYLAKTYPARGEFDHLPTGIYWGFARIGEASSEENDVSSVSVLGKAYIAAISIG